MEGDVLDHGFEDDELSSPIDIGPHHGASGDNIIRYANGEPVSKRTLQNRKAQREFRQRRANYLKELEEKVRRYESGQTENTQALQREIIQLREENDYLRNQLARFHADPNLMPLAPPSMPASASRMSFSAAPGHRPMPTMPQYQQSQFQPFYQMPPNSASGHLPVVTPHDGQRPRSPIDHRARSPFGADQVIPTSPGLRGRQASAPNLLGGPAEAWTADAPMRPLNAAESMPSLPPLSATSLRSSAGSPGPTSPQWYHGPPSAGLVAPKSWMPTPPDFAGHTGIHSPPTLHHPSGLPSVPPPS